MKNLVLKLNHKIKEKLFKKELIAYLPLLWLTIFFILPFLVVLKISFAQSVIAIPPYTAMFEWVDTEQILNISLNIYNYIFLWQDDIYINTYINSVKISFISTILCFLLAYPIAYVTAKASAKWKLFLLISVILPFWTSALLRSYALIGVLSTNGVINNTLISLGFISTPITMMQTDFAVYVGIVYNYLPFMVLPLYSSLEKLDLTLLEAAHDLGAKKWESFLYITVPLSMPGILAGSLLVFIPATGEFIIPALFAASDNLMIGRVLWDEFFLNRDWPLASALAINMLILLALPIILYRLYEQKSNILKK